MTILTRAVFPGFATFLVVLLTCAPVSAHGVLMESDPKQNAVLHHYPEKIILWFNASLEPAMTHVVLEDMARKVTPLSPTHESTIEQIVMAIPPLKPGVYQVRYRVLATDGHVTEGVLRFTLLSP